jgi:hypothetical protein
MAIDDEFLAELAQLQPTVGTNPLDKDKEEALSEIDALFQDSGLPPVTPESKEEDTPGDLIPGLKAGAHQTVNLINNAGNSALYHLLFKATGDERFRVAADAYLQDFQNINQAISETYPRNVESLKDADTLGKKIDWAQRMFGEGVTSWIPGLAAGATAAVLGAGPAALAATVAGTNFLTQHLPESHVNFKAEGVDSPSMLLFSAALKTGLDTVVPFQSLKKVFGGKLGDEVGDAVTGKLLGKVLGKEVVKGAVEEGITETAQQFVDQAAVSFLDDNYDLFSNENLWKLMESGLAGAIVGGPISGAATGIQHREALMDAARTLTNDITAPIRERSAKRVEEELDASIETTDENGQKIVQPLVDNIGEAVQILAASGVDPTLFSSDEARIKAANRLKKKQVREDELSAAAQKIIRPLPEQKKLTGPARSKVTSTPDVEKFFEERAEELMRAKILETPDAKTLVAHGIDVNDVVAMDFENMKRHAEAVRRSKSVMSTRAVEKGEAPRQKDVPIFLGSTEINEPVYTVKDLEARKNRLGEITRGNLAKSIEQMDLDALKHEKIMYFMPGDGVIVPESQLPTWDVILAQRQARIDSVADAAKNTQTGSPITPQQVLYGKDKTPAQTQTFPVSKGTLSLPNTRRKTLDGGTINHPYPESVQKGKFKESKKKLRKPLFNEKLKKGEVQTDLGSYTEQPVLPLIKSSKNWPWNDARRKATKPKKDKPRFQTFLPTREGQKLFQQHIVPNIVWNNIQDTPLRFEALEKMPDVAKNLERIVREIAGRKVDVKFVKTLEAIDPVTHETVQTLRGAQVRNILYVTLDNNPDNVETTAHEAWHVIRDELNLFSDQDKKLMNLELPKIMDWLDKQYGTDLLHDLADIYMEDEQDMTDRDMSVFRSEIEATAFGKYFADVLRGKTPEISSPFGRLFKKAVNFFNRFRNYLRGAGFRTFEDFFDTVSNGKFATASEYQDNINSTMAEARFQSLSRATQQKVFEQNAQQGRDAAENLLREIKKGDTRASATSMLNWRNRWIRSVAGAAHTDKVMATGFQLMRDKVDITHEFLLRYQEQLRPFFKNFKPEERAKILSLTDRVRKAKGKAQYVRDASGAITGLKYTDEAGLTKTLNDAKAAQGYAQVQEAFAQALNDIENMVREDITKYGLDRNITLQNLEQEILGQKQDVELLKTQLENLEKKMKGYNRRTQKPLIEALKPERKKLKADIKYAKDILKDVGMIRENIASLGELRKVDYIPHIRFGEFGLSVWRKEDLNPDGTPMDDRDPAYFATFERGSLSKHMGVDKFQYNMAKKELQEMKLLNNPDYVVFGLDKPFFLTQALQEKRITDRMITFELLAGLIGNADEKAYKAMKERLDTQLKHKGFAKVLSHNKNIPGYSKDWNRAVPFYFSGMAHFLGKNAVANRAATFKTMVETEEPDPQKKKNILEYLDYMQSPEEDYLAFRQLNFLWTMGMNFSTAALQVFTLPTSTLASMTQYNLNPIKNMGYISKWMGRGAKLFSGSQLEALRFEGGWQNPDNIRKMAEQGKLADRLPNMTNAQWKEKNKQYAEDIIQMLKIGQIRGFLTEDYAGQGSRDIRTTRGRMHEKFSEFTNAMGIPMAAMESLTRFATFMAHYDMLMSDPAALARAERVLKDDQLFQVMRENSPNRLALDVSRFGMDEAHAIFGKVGRHKLQRGIGGLIMPFMTYPQQQLEFMGRLLGRGKEGKIALAMNLAVLMMFAGMMGLPGAELLKEAYEAASRGIAGHEIDLDKIIRERLVDMGADPAFAVFVTQGIGRPVMGMDISKRLGMGLAVPGSGIAVAALGGQDVSLEAMGVQGSMLSNAIKAWDDYSSDGTVPQISQNLTPTFFSNVIKAYQMGHEGVISRRGHQLIGKEDVDFGMRLKRAIGVTPGEVASAREKSYWGDMAGREYDVFLRRQRQIVANLRAQRFYAMRDADTKKAQRLINRERLVLEKLKEWREETGYPLNLTEFNQTVKNMVRNRLTGEKPKNSIRKNARRQQAKIAKLTEGIDE